jgi:hypothetical protein
MSRQSRSCGGESSWIVGAIAGLAVLLSSSTSGASALYPTALDELLELDAVPKCVLCHATEAGGAGTAVKPFAQTLKTLGIEGGSNEASLKSAINKNIFDTDRDGVADVQELKEGSDPNVKDREVEPPPGTGGSNGSGSGGTAGDPGSPSGGTSGEGTAPEPGEAGSGSGDPQTNEGGAGESSQEPDPPPSDPPPSLPPPPPPPPGGGQDIPMRETGCAISAPRLHSALAPALLLGAACALAGRRRRRRSAWPALRSALG